MRDPAVCVICGRLAGAVVTRGLRLAPLGCCARHRDLVVAAVRAGVLDADAIRALAGEEAA